ncbi:MAG: homoserine dehydrogenase [Ruminococcaceae bacterium]|nr:homoserine dehydrogenase [Oscillospiraceae bacterium]
MVNVAIMGHGVVGSGVAEVLLKNSELIAKKAKNEIRIKHILDLRDFPEIPYSDLFTKDFNDIISDDDVKVVAEVMGGLHPAYEFTKQCLMAGKSVVTSNKELVATYGAELLALAEENNVNYLFEASVGGGIPVLRPIAQCLAANDLYEVEGILNGTTNFILTRMISDGMSFEDALKMAQDLGYAEKDPTADIEGHDACRKICILAALAFGKHVYPNSVYTEGITKITSADAAYADFADCAIKLIGHAKLLDDGKCTVAVYPAFVSRKNQLAHVNDVFNAITVKGDAIGNAMFYGPGAGKLPTASAVVADIIDCVKHLHARKYLSWDDCDADYIADHRKDTVRMYVRLGYTGERPAVIESITSLFGQIKVLGRQGEPSDELAFITPFASEEAIFSQLGTLKNCQVLSTLRMLD